jgi:nucleoside phosphorylase/ribosomal protein S18 acetylase RimI-like enzyme
MSGLDVRLAIPADAARIAALIVELAASMGETSPVSARYAKGYLGFPGSSVLLAEEDGQVIGLLSYSVRPDLFHAGNSALIEELVVSEHARGRGVGSALLNALLARLEASGCAEVSVSAMPDNAGALRFYRSHGLADEAVFLEKHFTTDPARVSPPSTGTVPVTASETFAPPTGSSSAPPTWFSCARAVVPPSEFAADLGAQSAVLCFSDPCYNALLDTFGMRDSGNAPGLGGAQEGKIGNMLAGQVDPRVAAYKAHFGAPAAGMLMECLIASGVKRLLMLGMAGSISPRCRIGEIIVPTWGISEDGVSWHYAPPGPGTPPSLTRTPRPSALLVDALRRYLREQAPGLEVKEGGVWTLDAIFRETLDKVERHAAEGALAVEMECAALMSIAAYRNVDFAAVLIITDELFSGSWEHDFEGERVRRARLGACRALAKVLLSA